MSLSQPKINSQFLSYDNYHKGKKKNVLMNRIQIDSGYPQDIFAKNTPYRNHDYLQDNKKNLKNFFKDRIPSQQITKDTFKIKTTTLDPAKMFQIKRQQYQLKNQTKIILNGSFLNRSKKKGYSQNKNIEKISELFLINDKTLQFKKKYASQNVQRFDSYNKDNHRRGTMSFVQKRSKIIKKQAYDQVFGPDISSISRTLPITPHLSGENRFSKTKNISTTLQRRAASIQSMQTKREQLSMLIKKIDEFKQKMKPVKLDYNQQPEQSMKKQLILDVENEENVIHKKLQKVQQNDQQKQKVVELIKNLTKVYKSQAVENNRQKINSIQDLQKLDSKFYQDLNKHKKYRIQKRMYQLYKYTIPQTNDLINSKIQNRNQVKKPFGYQRHLRKPSDILTITDLDNSEYLDIQDIKFKKRMNNHQKFRLLAKNLIHAVLQADINMVSNHFIFQAFWQVRQPYQMEGSYAFFKAIKHNDIQCVKTFIGIDNNYLYEVDTTGKTPLIYATLHNREKLVEYFLQLGSNIDKKCINKKSALYYAIQNKNLHLVRILLQHGAYPWSSNECSYKKMLQQLNNDKFNLIFSNAKKIFLGVRLQKGNKKRGQFWHENKHKINQNSIIQF